MAKTPVTSVTRLNQIPIALKDGSIDFLNLKRIKPDTVARYRNEAISKNYSYTFESGETISFNPTKLKEDVGDIRNIAQKVYNRNAGRMEGAAFSTKALGFIEDITDPIEGRKTQLKSMGLGAADFVASKLKPTAGLNTHGGWVQLSPSKAYEYKVVTDPLKRRKEGLATVVEMQEKLKEHNAKMGGTKASFGMGEFAAATIEFVLLDKAYGSLIKKPELVTKSLGKMTTAVLDNNRKAFIKATNEFVKLRLIPQAKTDSLVFMQAEATSGKSAKEVAVAGGAGFVLGLTLGGLGIVYEKSFQKLTPYVLRNELKAPTVARVAKEIRDTKVFKDAEIGDYIVSLTKMFKSKGLDPDKEMATLSVELVKNRKAWMNRSPKYRKEQLELLRRKYETNATVLDTEKRIAIGRNKETLRKETVGTQTEQFNKQLDRDIKDEAIFQTRQSIIREKELADKVALRNKGLKSKAQFNDAARKLPEAPTVESPLEDMPMTLSPTESVYKQQLQPVEQASVAEVYAKGTNSKFRKWFTFKNLERDYRRSLTLDVASLPKNQQLRWSWFKDTVEELRNNNGAFNKMLSKIDFEHKSLKDLSSLAREDADNLITTTTYEMAGGKAKTTTKTNNLNVRSEGIGASSSGVNPLPDTPNPAELFERGRLYSKEGETISGMYDRDGEFGNHLIYLFEDGKPTMSTLWHETFHWLATVHPNSPVMGSFGKYVDGVLFKVATNPANWTMQQHETMAMMFENFLREGVAPTRQLKQLFKRMAGYMDDIQVVWKSTPSQRQMFANMWKNSRKVSEGHIKLAADAVAKQANRIGKEEADRVLEAKAAEDLAGAAETTAPVNPPTTSGATISSIKAIPPTVQKKTTIIQADANAAKINADVYRMYRDEAAFDNWINKVTQKMSPEIDAVRKKDLEYALQSLPEYVKYFNRYSDVIIQTTDKFKAFVYQGGFERAFVMDFTENCPRSLGFRNTLITTEAAINRSLTSDELLIMADVMRRANKVIPCMQCYVEAARRNRMEFIYRFIDTTTTSIGSSYEYTIDKIANFPARVAFVERGEKLPDNFFHKLDYYAKQKKYADVAAEARDYLTGSKARTVREGVGEYRGEILNTALDSLNKWQGVHGGLRWFGSSDAEPSALVEMMQTIVDMSMQKLKGYAYSKQDWWIKAFAPTGLHINQSLAVKVGKDGKFTQDLVNGMDWKTAVANKELGDNVGIVMITHTDDQLGWALTQDWIDTIIPTHMANMRKEHMKFFDYINLRDDAAAIAYLERDGGLVFDALKVKYPTLDRSMYFKLKNNMRKPELQEAVKPVWNYDVINDTILNYTATKGKAQYAADASIVDLFYKLIGNKKGKPNFLFLDKYSEGGLESTPALRRMKLKEPPKTMAEYDETGKSIVREVTGMSPKEALKYRNSFIRNPEKIKKVPKKNEYKIAQYENIEPGRMYRRNNQVPVQFTSSTPPSGDVVLPSITKDTEKILAKISAAAKGVGVPIKEIAAIWKSTWKAGKELSGREKWEYTVDAFANMMHSTASPLGRVDPVLVDARRRLNGLGVEAYNFVYQKMNKVVQPIYKDTRTVVLSPGGKKYTMRGLLGNYSAAQRGDFILKNREGVDLSDAMTADATNWVNSIDEMFLKGNAEQRSIATAIQSASSNMNAAYDEMLQKFVDMGIILPEQKAAMNQLNPFYTSFRRDLEPSNLIRGITELHGSKLPILNPLDTFVENMETLYMYGEQNNFTKDVVAMMLRDPASKWQNRVVVKEVIRPGAELNIEATKEYIKAPTRPLNVNEVSFVSYGKRYIVEINDRFIRDGIKLNPILTWMQTAPWEAKAVWMLPATLKRSSIVLTPFFAITNMIRDTTLAAFADQTAYKSYNLTRNQYVNIVLDMFLQPQVAIDVLVKALDNAVVKYPLIFVGKLGQHSRIWRDIESNLTSKMGGVGSKFQANIESYRNKLTDLDMHGAGGSTYAREYADIQHVIFDGLGIKRKWYQVGGHPLRYIEGLMQILEDLPRKASAIRAMDKGLNATAAADIARAITADFSDKGVFSSAVSMLRPFYSAQWSGLRAEARLLANPKTAGLFMARILWAGVLPTALITYNAFSDPEFMRRYRKLDSFSKSAYLYYGIDENTGEFKRVRKPNGIIGLSLNVVQGIMEKAFYDNIYQYKNAEQYTEGDWYEFFNSLTGLKDVIPTVAENYIGLKENRKPHFGSNIQTPFGGDSPILTASLSDTEVQNAISTAYNKMFRTDHFNLRTSDETQITPKQVAYLEQAFLGAYGKGADILISDAISQLKYEMGGKEPPVRITTDPAASSFNPLKAVRQKLPDMTMFNKTVEQYRVAYKRVSKRAQEINRMNLTDKDAEDYTSAERTAKRDEWMLKYYNRHMKRSNDKLQKIQDEMLAIKRGDDPQTEAAAQKALDDLAIEYNDIAEEALNDYLDEVKYNQP